jgi:hypothetical protein
MCSGFGPTQREAQVCARRSPANFAFSDEGSRSQGWIASAARLSAAEMMFGLLRSSSIGRRRLGRCTPPRPRGARASRRLSAVECTATGCTPNSRHARMDAQRDLAAVGDQQLLDLRHYSITSSG